MSYLDTNKPGLAGYASTYHLSDKKMSMSVKNYPSLKSLNTDAVSFNGANKTIKNLNKKPYGKLIFQPAFENLKNSVLKSKIYFCSSLKDKLLSGLTAKLNKEKAPNAIKQGLTELIESMYDLVEEFENNPDISAENPQVAIKRLEEQLNKPQIKNLKDTLAKKNPGNLEALDLSPSMPFNEYVSLSNSSRRHCCNKKMLQDSYELYYTRRLLAAKTVEILNHYKNLEGIKPYKDEINKIVDVMNNKIRLVGLSKETRGIVEAADKNLNIKLDIVDSPEMADFIYSTLDFYKNKLGLSLPYVIEFNNIDWFTDEIQTLGYFAKACSNNIDGDFKTYMIENDQFNKRNLYFNPFYIQEVLQTKDYEKFYRKLKHEMVHLWHNEIIGDNSFYGPNNLTFADILEPGEKKLFDQFKDIVSKVNSGLAAQLDNLEKIPSAFESVVNKMKSEGSFKDKLTVEMVKDLKPVIEKFAHANRLVDEIQMPATANEYRKYVRTSPLELVAIAMEFNNSKDTYSPEFEAILEKLRAPQISGRTELPESHPLKKNNSIEFI